MTCAFVDNYHINTYLKLRVLLSLYQQPQRSLSLDELCEQFFVADRREMEELLSDLCQRRLLSCDGSGWTKGNLPNVDYCLACLARTFEDPLARQRLLDQIARRPPSRVH